MGKKRMFLVGGACLAWTAPALAQQAAAAPQDPQRGIEEIVVTAQKREQNLQNVPVAVTAVTADTIAKQRLVAFSDLTRVTPALTVTQQSNSPNNSINLRGIGTFAFSIGVEPSVAVVIDDLAVVQQAQAFSNLSDVARIEVLQGPQGTLFGKNASAGVVNIVTQDPTNTLTGNVSTSAATDQDYRVDGSVSGPLSDSVGLRVGGFYHSYAGNVRNLYDGHLLNDEESWGLRAKLKLELSDRLTYTINGNYSQLNQAGSGTTLYYVNPNSTPRVLGLATLPLSANLTGITPGPGNYATNVDNDGPSHSKTAVIAARGVLNLGAIDLTSVTGYQDWRYDFSQEVDGTALDINSAVTGGASHGGINQSGPYHSTSFTQELRLNSHNAGRLKYMLGAFFADSNTSRSFTRGPAALLASWQGKAGSQSAAVFAQGEYALPTGTTVTGGLRFNHEHVSGSFDNTLATATAATCATGTPGCQGTHNDDVVTWKVSLAQELTHGVMAYGSVGTGYKGYAYDVSTGFTPARVNGTAGPVKAEHSTAYELGLKSRFLDNRVQFNAALFLTDYNNFQAQSAITVDNAIQVQLNNVGSLRTKGAEAELTAKPMAWLKLDASAAYTDATIRSFQNAQAYAGQLASDPACTTAGSGGLCSYQNRSGGQLPNAPKFKFSLGSTAETPLPSLNAKGIFTLTYQHQSSVNFDLLGSPLTVQKAYGVLNGSIGLERDKFTFTLFINNIANVHYASYMSDAFGTYGGTATNPAHVISQFLSRDSQRYAGLKLGYKF
jgi:iron complex outermembrane recepter protein